MSNYIYIVDDFLRMHRQAVIYTEDDNYFYILLSNKFSIRVRKDKTFYLDDFKCLGVKYENVMFEHCIGGHSDL